MRAKMPMVFQRFNLFANLNVLHNVTEAQRRVLKRSRDEAETIAVSVLERVGLSKKIDSDVSSLSGGQQQRVAIARALAMKPEVILFDEPTSSLDPENVGEVLAVMKEVAADGMTIIVVTHEMSFARRTADVITLIRDGAIIESGAPAEIMESPKMEYTKSFIGGLSRAAN
jgi:polar amino acid transport system ATP-binding protein